MAKDIFDTIIEKDYHQLTSQELTELADYCQNEQDFLAMKQVLTHSKTVADGPKLSPKEVTKEKLDNLFDSTYGKSRRFIPFYLNPIFQIAAVIAVGFAVWMFLQKNESIAPDQLAKKSEVEKEGVIESPIEPKSINDSTSMNTTYKAIGYNGNVVEFKLKEEIEAVADYSEPAHLGQFRSMEEGEIVYLEESTSSNHFSDKDEADTKKKEISHDVTSRQSIRVSTPANSINDISVVSDKKPAQQTVTSMNVSEQKNVLIYLVAKY